jgi:hypothetical protein
MELSGGVLNIIRDGINSIDINGTGGFALGDLAFIDSGSITFNSVTDVLTGSIDDLANETLSFGSNVCPEDCPPGPNSYFFDGGGAVDEWGTFTVSPEPSSWILLATCAVPIVIWQLTQIFEMPSNKRITHGGPERVGRRSRARGPRGTEAPRSPCEL